MPIDTLPVRRRSPRILHGALLAVAVALAGLAAAFLWGVAIPGEFLRAPLERALTAAFGVPTRIEGPLQVRTGLTAAATADALVLADPSGPVGATIARATRPAVRIDLPALLRRVVALDEVTGERLELALVRAADGRGNWAPIFATAPDSGPPPVSFGGIGRLRIDSVAGTYRGPDAAPVPFGIADLQGALPLRDPTTAKGTATNGGNAIAFDLRTASLAGLLAPGAAIPLQGTLGGHGARIAVDGTLAGDGSKLDAGVQVAADDAAELLAALGIAAREPGRLEGRARVAVTAADAVISEVSLTLGKSAVSGSARVAWSAPRLRLAIDLAGERVDLHPFLSAAPSATDKPAAEAFIELLERAATGAEAEIKAAVGELAGLAVTVHDLKAEGRSGDRVVAVRGDAVIAGTRAKATLDYDASKPQRILAARIDGGAVSAGKLLGPARPEAFSGSSGGIRGQLRAQGATPREIMALAQGSLDARDVRWSVAGKGGEPVRGRFDAVRIAVQGTRASSAEVSGKIGDAACTLKASGGALAPLVEGAQWPVQLAGSCGGGRLGAKGHIALAARRIAAELAFNAAADRIGPLAQALGVAPDAPHPFAARGTLWLDEKLARMQLDAFRLGRTAGSGEIAFPLGAGGAPRVQLALSTVNLDELNALGGAAPTASDPLQREVLRAKLRLPDADFEIAADRVETADVDLRRLHLSGAMRAGRLPPARFAIEWAGVPLSGQFGADFTGAAPRVELDAAARNADFGALLARFGQQGVGLRVGAIALRASARGGRLGELLESASLDATIERGRLTLARPPVPGLAGPADFSAELKATPGQPVTLAARGTLGGEAFDLGLETPNLTGLARAGEPVPATLRLALGDARLQASGRVARDGTGEGRIQLGGERVDRLGKLAGVTLPEVGPYAASGTLAVSADSTRATDVDVSFGKSRLLGHAQMQVRRGGRPLHAVALRAPMLHLEDLGAARWLAGPGQRKDAATREAAAAGREEAEMARALDLLRASDLDATVEVDALHGGSERFASGRLRATLAAGALRVLLQDVHTASGVVDADLRIDASGPQPKLAVRARAEGLEYGPFARTVDPQTTKAGRLDLVVDLTAQGPPGNLLPAVAGTVDAAVYPRDMGAAALDFWGTGLLRSMLRSVDPNTRSTVECAVASWDLDAGVARTRAFFVDTTRVRIIGQVDVDLLTHALAGRVRPQAEHPELFTVAPTMVLGGTIEDPRVTAAPESLVLAPLRFATPLAGSALEWLNPKGSLPGGAAGCRVAFDQARRTRPAPGTPQ